MLIYTYKLEQYVLHNILPKILLSTRYKIKGSFKRKIPYVTDIDIVNYVNPEIDKINIRESLIKLIISLESVKNVDTPIKLIYVTCGSDDRFYLDNYSDDKINKLKKLLKKEEITELNKIIEIYDTDSEKKLFYINEMIRPMYKLRWTIKDIMENKIKRRGNHIITFDSVIKNNCSLTIRYFIDINSIPIGFDVAVYYEKVNCFKIYANAAKRTIQISNYKKDYYYMLFPLKYYFRSDPIITKELEDIIEKKFGPHKQIMVRIDTYHLLYVLKILDIKTATNIVTKIIQSIELYVPDVAKSNTLSIVKKTAENNPPNVKMEEWNIQLDVLYDELLETANIACKDYFYKIVELIPFDMRKDFYI